MVFHQRVDDNLGCASYLIGDETSGEAVVVDPAYAIEPYLEEAERHGLRITNVLETHTHADHLSGHGRFALEHGALIHVHPLGEPEFPFEPLADGQLVRVGETAIRVLHTPGHRPEHCCFLVDGRLLTGDSLLVDTKAGYAFERIPKAEVEDLVLEEVPDVSYNDIDGLSAAIGDALEAAPDTP